MSRTEKRTWASLIAGLLIFAHFWLKMTDGWDIPSQSPAALLEIIINMVILTIVAEAIIASGLLFRRNDQSVETDEREMAISEFASRAESFAVISGINIVVFHAVLNATFEGHIFPRLDPTRLETLILMLLSTLWLGHFVRLCTVLVRSKL